MAQSSEEVITEGRYVVTFLNGDMKTISVEANLIDFNGHPLYLKAKNGELYNWMNIVSVRRTDSGRTNRT